MLRLIIGEHIMTLQEAYLSIASKLPTDPNVKARFDRGYDIVRELDKNGYSVVKVRTIGQYVYYVSKLSTSLVEDVSRKYVVDTVKKTCTCPDFETARGGLCKHRFAIMLMEEMEK